MENTVKILANKETGETITWRTIEDSDGNQREVGVVMLQSITLNNSSIGGLSKRVAFKTLEKEAIEFIGEANLVDGTNYPQQGKIVVTETLVPYVSKSGKTQEPKRNPTTGEVILYKGQPIYRNSEFTADLNTQDVFLKDNASVPDHAKEQLIEDDLVM